MIRTCKCGKEVASNARVCPHCGNRFTSNITAGLALAFAFIIIAAFYGAAKDPEPKPAPPAKTVQQIEDDNYSTAIYACEEWTKKNSRVAVDEFIGEYRYPEKKRVKNFRVWVEYRTKGAGWPMRTRCEVAHEGSNYVIVKAVSELNR